eukprot:TRINITY_DN2047_c0_g1_i1.p1 TRINITY_DN2047_c0_g1~~TRINITY_DN2047_c0_g1_i1.p1  ORF type:complete len:512 (+),score=78.95 TRINITY_DN2047_c0_g1_i1:209-1744(+)
MGSTAYYAGMAEYMVMSCKEHRGPQRQLKDKNRIPFRGVLAGAGGAASAKASSVRSTGVKTSGAKGSALKASGGRSASRASLSSKTRASKGPSSSFPASPAAGGTLLLKGPPALQVSSGPNALELTATLPIPSQEPLSLPPTALLSCEEEFAIVPSSAPVQTQAPPSTVIEDLPVAESLADNSVAEKALAAEDKVTPLAAMAAAAPLSVASIASSVSVPWLCAPLKKLDLGTEALTKWTTTITVVPTCEPARGGRPNYRVIAVLRPESSVSRKFPGCVKDHSEPVKWNISPLSVPSFPVTAAAYRKGNGVGLGHSVKCFRDDDFVFPEKAVDSGFQSERARSSTVTIAYSPWALSMLGDSFQVPSRAVTKEGIGGGPGGKGPRDGGGDGGGDGEGDEDGDEDIYVLPLLTLAFAVLHLGYCAAVWLKDNGFHINLSKTGLGLFGVLAVAVIRMNCQTSFDASIFGLGASVGIMTWAAERSYMKREVAPSGVLAMCSGAISCAFTMALYQRL